MNNIKLDMSDIYEIIDIAFKNNQSIILKVRGMSMFPLLKDNRDSFKLEKITSKPKRKDIVLYKRDNGQYVLHRIIKENLRGRMNEKRIAHYEKILDEVASRSSKLERRADEAERETDKLKKVEYMSEHIGEEFEGVISGVTEWGFYVELPNTIEGLVHVTSLSDDYYHYNERSYELIGETTNRKYKLGQKVRVYVESTDKFLRTIDFGVVPVLNEEEL